MKKRFLCLLLVCLLLTMLPVTAKANVIPDTSKKDCSIQVVLWDKQKDKGIVGAELVCYRFGYVGIDSNKYYHFYDAVSNQEIPNSTIQSTSAPALYEADVKKEIYKEKYSETFEKEGIYYFTNLPTGLYLVMQTKAASGYADMKPFFVTVPYLENDTYKYDVTAQVKTEIKQEIAPPTETTETNGTTGSTNPPYGNKLPQTGQLTWPIPWLASSGMLLFAIGWWLCFGRRKDSYEN